MAQTGPVRSIVKVIDLGLPFAVTSPNVIITLPDNSSFTDSNGISISPSGTASPQTLSYLYLPQIGGLHKGYFQYIALTKSIKTAFTFWSTWNDIYDSVRILLGVTKSTLPDNIIDIEFIQLFIEFMDMSGNSLPTYSAFNTIYQNGFDTAMIKLIAARLRPNLGGRGPTGEVILFKKGTTTAQYSTGPKPRFTIESEWWDQGIAILDATIPELSSVFASNRSGDMIMTRGPLAIGNHHPLAGWIIDSTGGNLITDGSEM